MEHGKAYSVHFYPGVNHGFHNDTTPRYDAEAAELAWEADRWPSSGPTWSRRADLPAAPPPLSRRAQPRRRRPAAPRPDRRRAGTARKPAAR